MSRTSFAADWWRIETSTSLLYGRLLNNLFWSLNKEKGIAIIVASFVAEKRLQALNDRKANDGAKWKKCSHDIHCRKTPTAIMPKVVGQIFAGVPVNTVRKPGGSCLQRLISLTATVNLLDAEWPFRVYLPHSKRGQYWELPKSCSQWLLEDLPLTGHLVGIWYELNKEGHRRD